MIGDDIPAAFGSVSTNVEPDGTLTRTLPENVKISQKNLPQVLTSDWNEVGFEMASNMQDDILY